MQLPSSHPVMSCSLVSQPQATGTIGNRISSIRATLRFWLERDKTRVALSRLENWQLEDLGLTQEQVNAESNKLFWQD